MNALEGCRWAPRWASHLGCIRGCLDFLGIDISDGWLYGGTGHAFVINLHEGVCPSGPTAWRTMKLFELGRNLGYRLDGVFGFKGQPDFAEVAQRAWQHVREAIDRGQPCYGWELEIPEFYVVYGYDDVGYYYSGPGCDEGKGPKDWQSLGDTGIGVLELYSVGPGEAVDDVTVVREALTFALEIAANPAEWIFEHYRAGLEGFDNWIRALESGKASDRGTRYNGAVWLECRQNAVAFLAEAKHRLAGRAKGPLDLALASYQSVTEALENVTSVYPWSYEASDQDLLPVDERGQAAVEALRVAREAEAAGLRALEEILQAL